MEHPQTTALDGPRRLRFGGRSERPNQVWCGDNLALLGFANLSGLDLVYVDPPFATGTTRRGRRRGGAAAPSYDDRLSDPEAFVAWLSPRLACFREALSATGSLFVHLDARVVHYVKVELDRLFGRSRFVNEIVWCYSVGGKSRRSFGRKHDTILWYARTADYAFHADAVRIARKPRSHMRVVQDGDGQLVQEKTDRKSGKVYRYPVSRGKVPEDWWTDIETLNRDAAERTGYPTQKPRRLLERIMAATTVPGDRVADFFCGSGTTGVVAQADGRDFVLIDESPHAIAVASARLADEGQRLASQGRPPPDVCIGVSR